MAYSFQPCKYTKKKLIVVIEFSFLNENKLFFAMSDILRIFAKPNRKHIILVTSCFAKGKMAERFKSPVFPYSRFQNFGFRKSPGTRR